MGDMITNKVAQLSLKTAEQKLKTSSSPNGATVSIGTNRSKDKSISNPWKSRELTNSTIDTKGSSHDQPIHGLLEDPEAWPNLNTKLDTQHTEQNNHAEEKQKPKVDTFKYQPKGRYYATNSVGGYYNNSSGPVNTRSRRGYGRSRYQSDGRVRGMNGYFRSGARGNMSKQIHDDNYLNTQTPSEPDTVDTKTKNDQCDTSSNFSVIPTDESVKLDVNSQVDSKTSSPKGSNDGGDTASNHNAPHRRDTRDRNSSGQQNMYSDTGRHRRSNTSEVDPRVQPSVGESPHIIPSQHQPIINSTYLIPSSLSGGGTALFNSAVHMNVQPNQPIIQDVFFSPVPTVPNPMEPSLAYPTPMPASQEILHEPVDINQVTSYCSSVGWDKTVIPPALAKNPYILAAKASGDATGDKNEKSQEVSESANTEDTQKISGKREDVVIVDNKVYFVPKNYLQTKFLKFTSKMDYIRHHINYYFSKTNLARDEHLLSIISENKNACPIKDLLQFNRIRWVNTTESELHEAVKYCPLVTVTTSDDGKTTLIPTQLPDSMNFIHPHMPPQDLSQTMLLHGGATLSPQVVMNVPSTVVQDGTPNVSADTVQSSGDGPGNSFPGQTGTGNIQTNIPFELQNNVATSQPLPSSMMMSIIPPGAATYAAPNIFPQNIPSAALINHSAMQQVGPQPMSPVGASYLPIHPSQNNYIFPASFYSHQGANPFYSHHSNIAGPPNSVAAQMQVLVAAQQNTFFHGGTHHPQVAASNGNIHSAVHSAPQMGPVGRYPASILTHNPQNPNLAAGILQFFTQANQQGNDPSVFNRTIVATNGPNYYVPLTSASHMPGQQNNHFIGHNMHASHLPYIPSGAPSVSSPQGNMHLGAPQSVRFPNLMTTQVNVGQPRSSPMSTTLSTSMNTNSIQFSPAHSTSVGSNIHTKISNESPVGNQSDQSASVTRSESLPGTNE